MVTPIGANNNTLPGGGAQQPQRVKPQEPPTFQPQPPGSRTEPPQTVRGTIVGDRVEISDQARQASGADASAATVNQEFRRQGLESGLRQPGDRIEISAQAVQAQTDAATRLQPDTEPPTPVGAEEDSANLLG